MTPNFFFGLLGFKLLMMHRNIHLKTNGSQFEINKEALRPTISNSSDINRDPITKALEMEIILN